jgi:hypothetical protein
MRSGSIVAALWRRPKISVPQVLADVRPHLPLCAAFETRRDQESASPKLERPFEAMLNQQAPSMPNLAGRTISFAPIAGQRRRELGQLAIRPRPSQRPFGVGRQS